MKDKDVKVLFEEWEIQTNEELELIRSKIIAGFPYAVSDKETDKKISTLTMVNRLIQGYKNTYITHQKSQARIQQMNGAIDALEREMHHLKQELHSEMDRNPNNPNYNDYDEYGRSKKKILKYYSKSGM